MFILGYARGRRRKPKEPEKWVDPAKLCLCGHTINYHVKRVTRTKLLEVCKHGTNYGDSCDCRQFVSQQPEI